MRLDRWLSFGLLICCVALYVALGTCLSFPEDSEVAVAQSSSASAAIVEQVYQRLPNLPLKNQYVRSKGGQVATESTLVTRLIQYHTNVKGRSTLYRLDWKITLADYLGINDYLLAETYPGHNLFQTNPMEGDRAAIRKLTQAERDTLIQALVDSYIGKAASRTDAGDRPATPAPASPPSTDTRSNLTPLPTPGGAQLLQDPSGATTPNPQPTGDARFLAP